MRFYDALVDFRNDFFRCVGSEEEVYHISVCLQHSETFEIQCHQASGKSVQQQLLCLSFYLKLEAALRDGFRGAVEAASVFETCQEAQK